MARGSAHSATVESVHHLALGMPHVTVHPGTEHRPVYQVGGKAFIFFRNPRPDGHLSVLVRASRLDELRRDELAEVIQDAWLSRASTRRAADWLAARGLT